MGRSVRARRDAWHAVVLLAGAASIGLMGFVVLRDQVRRARLRERVRRRRASASGRILGVLRGGRHRTAQVVAGARGMIRGVTRAGRELVRRVGPALAAMTSSPFAVRVGAENGRVLLSGGPVLQGETERLMRAARDVEGVGDVDVCVSVYESLSDVPSSLHAAATPARAWQPVVRASVGVVALGAVLLGLGRRARLLPGWLAVPGAVLLAHALRRPSAVPANAHRLGSAASSSAKGTRPVRALPHAAYAP